MYKLFKKNREAVKKYLLIFFLGIVSVGMVVTLAPIPSGDSGSVETNILAEMHMTHNFTTWHTVKALCFTGGISVTHIKWPIKNALHVLH